MNRGVLLCAVLGACTPATRSAAPPRPELSVAPSPRVARAPSAAVPARAAEPESEAPPAACQPSAPPLALRVCPDARLDALLREFERADRELGPVTHCQALTVADLEPVEPAVSRFGDPTAPPGFFGDQDLDGDGRRDLVRLFSSVDYWGWLLFRREPSCFRFVADVEGYQVRLLPSKHGGLRDLEIFTYPLQGKLETLRFDGNGYAP